MQKEIEHKIVELRQLISQMDHERHLAMLKSRYMRLVLKEIKKPVIEASKYKRVGDYKRAITLRLRIISTQIANFIAARDFKVTTKWWVYKRYILDYADKEEIDIICGQRIYDNYMASVLAALIDVLPSWLRDAAIKQGINLSD